MSTFSLDEDQRQIKESMESFAADELRPLSRDCDEKFETPPELLEKTWGLGLTANIIPEEFGGYGFNRSCLNNVIMAEALAHGDLSLSLAAMAPNLFVLPILEMGTDAQKKKYLPTFCGDKYKVGTLAIMEHSISYDPFNVQTKAVPSKDSYVLNGEKCLVPMAEQAEYMLVIASTDKGTGAFIVEKNTAGVSLVEKEKNMGLNALPLYRVAFKDCKVPVENCLGGEKGIDYTRLLCLSRIGLSATMVGVSQAILDYAIKYAKERTAFGFPIATRQSIAFMLADAAIEIEGIRSMTWKAAWTADQGDAMKNDLLRISYLTKTYAAEQAFKISDYGVSILGGHGLIREHNIELWFRNARAFSMLEGLAMA